ncbi:MAG: 1-deoxy-D-xylulose-5-phosphate reductoisomerase [Bacteroidota bacterium]
MPRQIAVLGSTGSIGTQTLEIVRLFPDKLQVCALAANRNVALLAEQAAEFRPACVVIGDASCYEALKEQVAHLPVEVLVGAKGLDAAARMPEVHTVVAALVGFAGLASVVAGIKAGKEIALANKETLVAAGALVNEHLAALGGTMVPIDSEHSAIFQCMVGESDKTVEKITLTASGGPFRTRTAAFETITRAEALAHPNWSMGAKITIDSATMMNKGLEVIEARWLFDLPAEQIDVLVHPQSIVHSLVTFNDGSTKAQLGAPDMRVPIQYALSYPDRWSAPHPRIDWMKNASLTFESPDFDRFPCLRLAFEALAAGGAAPAVLNAANEVAVGRFLKDDIRFVDIPILIEAALARFSAASFNTLEELVDLHNAVQAVVLELNRTTTN